MECLSLQPVVEPRVLYRNTGLRREGLEEVVVIVAEGARITEPVAHKQRSEQRAIAL